MTREKISEGLEKMLYDRYGSYGVTIDRCDSDAILSYLHSQGVVIKADGELPDSLMEGQISYDRQTYKDMLERQGGFVAVEPLIKEE